MFTRQRRRVIGKADRSNHPARARQHPPPGLHLEELEPRVLLSAGGANRPIASEAGVQQMPSLAVDPHDAHHLVVAYMDRSLVRSGYAGIGAAVSLDAGDTW